MPHSSSQVQGHGWESHHRPHDITRRQKGYTQAVSDHRVKAGGPGCPRVNLPVKQPFRFNPSRTSLSGDTLTPYSVMEDEPLDGLPEDKGIIGDGETSDHGHLDSLPLLQTVASKVIEAQYPWHLQCHPVQITWMDPDVLEQAGGIKKRHV